MMVSADIALSDGRHFTLVPGDIIGRMRSCALRINHPSISEAHALVSLRGMNLRLLGLRGRFRVASKATSEVILDRGLVIHLTTDITITVEDVILSTHVIALDVPGLGRIIPPPVASIFPQSPDLVPGFSASASAVVWTDGLLLHVLRPPTNAVTCEVGDTFDVNGHTYAVVSAPIADALVTPTTANPVAHHPITLLLRFDTVHVQVGEATFGINGVPARILTELGLYAVPIEWRTVARTLWPDEHDESRLRMNWDSGLARLRRRLREIAGREDIVKTDGSGRAELMLASDDRIVDET